MDVRLPANEPPFDMTRLFEASSLRLCLIEPENAQLLAVSPDLRQLIPDTLGESFDLWCDPDDRYWLDRWLRGTVPEATPYLTVAAVQEGQLAGGQWHLLRHPAGVVGVLSLSSDGPGFPPMVTALLDHLPTDLAVLDAQGRYLYTNRAAIRDDRVREGIIGLTDRQYVEWRGHPLRLAELREEQFHRAVTTHQAQQWEEVLETPQGLRTFRRSYIPVWSAQGELQLMLGYGTDITQSVAQARQVGLLERVVLTSRDPTMLLDASPGERHRQLVYANLAFERLGLCSTLQSLIGTRLSEWGFGRRDEALLSSLLDRLERDETLETEVLLPDRQQWVEFSAQAIHNDDGELTHWAIHLRNVTARKRTEQLRQSRLQAGTLSVEGRSIPEVLAPLLVGIQQWAPGWTAAVVFGLDGEAQVAGDVSRAFRRWLTRVTSAEFRAIWAERDPQHLARPHHHRDLWHEPQLAVHHQKLRRAGIRSTVEVPLYDHASRLLGVLFLSYPAVSEAPALVSDVLIDEASAVTLFLERDRQRHHLELLAYSDPLTGLLNRFAFLKYVETHLGSLPANAPGLPWPCWISTASSRSMTVWATRWETSC
ncbi:PAS domain-containing protein (plasmid) [Deinococcus sp. KNUC1210]|uniref:sensor domain-containing protein n=1 Tax=Deinococcus sp. KNUC1210 TaxID=2917691 RepID=UPI001EF1607D|nr:PAS domain-containing protein [Deinococcus sp. KNUC1210]ULH16959.1 PAS domain-containing protein [Deinococcus sp. KNUC1210]